jgi:hypothetical protein
MLGINTNDMKNLLNTALAFSKETTFYIKDDTLYLRMLDTAHVAMVIASAPLTSTPDNIDMFTVNVEQMQKALGIVGDDVEIEIKDGLVSIKGSKSKVKLPLIVTDSHPPKVPDIEVVANAFINPADLKNTLNYAIYNKCDHFYINIEDGHMVIQTGDYPSVAEIDGTEDGVGTAKAGYPIEYMASIVDLAGKCKSQLEVCLMGDDFPAIFKWNGETAQYSVLLAPRIETE